jgi:hypothetical protein
MNDQTVVSEKNDQLTWGTPKKTLRGGIVIDLTSSLSTFSNRHIEELFHWMKRWCTLLSSSGPARLP